MATPLLLRCKCLGLGAMMLAVAVIAASVRAADWPQFRGPNCTGISVSSEPLPVRFSARDNVAWTREIGEGVGCPVVADGRAFVLSALDEGTITLFAFDVESGRQLWRRDWNTGPLPEVHKTNSHASTTPAADDQRVYFYFSTLGITAVDAETGRDAWHTELPKPFFVFKWGPAMSPVLFGDKILFCQDDDLYPAIYALDKQSGQILWKDERYEMAVNYSHPVVCTTDRGNELVVGGTGMLIGYDPDDGERLWHAKTLLRNIKTTPVARGDMLYLSLQSSGIANQWLATADRSETGNSDGRLSKAEMQAFVGKTEIPEAFYQKTFDRGDANGDGFLEGAELDTAFLHPDNFAGARFDVEEPADELIVAVRAGGRGDVTATHVVWKHATKYTDHIVSPLVHGDRMLLVKCGGITTVFETQRGTPLRGPKRLPVTGDFFASPVYGDGKIYIAGENGFVVVLKDDANYQVLAKNDMEDAIVATPAIADGRLLVRTRSKLICVVAENR